MGKNNILSLLGVIIILMTLLGGFQTQNKSLTLADAEVEVSQLIEGNESFTQPWEDESGSDDVVALAPILINFCRYTLDHSKCLFQKYYPVKKIFVWNCCWKVACVEYIHQYTLSVL